MDLKKYINSNWKETIFILKAGTEIENVTAIPTNSKGLDVSNTCECDMEI